MPLEQHQESTSTAHNISDADLIRMLKDPNIGIDIRDRRWHLKTYKKCFVGSAFVEWLLKHHKNIKSKEQAIKYGQELMDRYIIHHVCHSEPFKDGEYYYRLQEDDDLEILNMKRIFLGTPRKPSAKSMREILLKLHSKFVSSDGTKVDYKEMMKSDIFTKEYMLCIEELQRVDVGALTIPERKAFFLNIYNSLVMHGFLAIGIPSTRAERMKFFNKTQYNIGGNNYSLVDIEHGILRGNRLPPGSFTRRISPKDPRRFYVFTKVDPRVHFALNCGAKSCPPIRVYDADQIDQQLDLAAKSFCNAELVFDQKNQRVLANKIFIWYREDFGKNDKEILEWILPYLNEDNKKILSSMISKGLVKIKALPYDWEPNQS